MASITKATEVTAVICDIDGTIADVNHRLGYVNGSKKDWKVFFSLISQDKPLNRNIAIVLDEIKSDNQLIFVTGRPDIYKDETIKWLNENTPFKNYKLFMRKFNDFREDVVIKEEILKKIQKQYLVVSVFEDRSKLQKMWESNGLNCFLLPDKN